MEWPAAEIEVDEALVRELLGQQHPDLASLALRETGAGWDNTLWRLGAGLLVRLPRRASPAPLVVNEQRWLAELAPRLPLPVPAPVRTGRPTDRFPWPWSVVPWFDGVPGDRATITQPDDAARRLGRFLKALHQEASADAPENPWRGVALAERQDTFDERLEALAAEIDVDAARAVWDRAVEVGPPPGPAVWLHGDMHPANTLIAGGTLSAVIDFGDICRGDPATDLAGAWMLLPASSMDRFHAAYGAVDDALAKRTLGWAVLFGLMLLGIGLGGRPTYEAVGRSTLDKVIGPVAATESWWTRIVPRVEPMAPGMEEINDGETTWRFDRDFLESRWECLWGRGCLGIGPEPAADLGLGCCSIGADLGDEDEARMIAALAAALEPDLFERHAEADEGGIFHDEARIHTRVVDGACIFLNRPGFAGGAGCALHLAALAAGESPMEWKPSVCWQLPVKVDWTPGPGDTEVATVHRWTRQDWGAEGKTMAWCCTEGEKAYVGERRVIDSLGAELEAMVGARTYVELRRRMDEPL